MHALIVLVRRPKSILDARKKMCTRFYTATCVLASSISFCSRHKGVLHLIVYYSMRVGIRLAVWEQERQNSSACAGETSNMFLGRE